MRHIPEARLDTRGRDDKTVIELLEDVKEKCKAELDRARKTLHGQGMTDRQIEDAVAAGKRLPGYPSKTQLQKLRNLDPVLEYLRTLK